MKKTNKLLCFVLSLLFLFSASCSLFYVFAADSDSNGHETCNNCNGTGSITSRTKCPTCNGEGQITHFGSSYVKCLDCNGYGGAYVKLPTACNSCKGFGAVYIYSCSRCGNAGYATSLTSKRCNLCGGMIYIYKRPNSECSRCKGTGILYELKYSKCPTCNGKGERYVGSNSYKTSCGTCNGSGYKNQKNTCTICNGSGIINTHTHSGGEANCINRAICETCGVEYGAVNDSNHKSTRIINYVAATEFSEGYTGDTYCDDCKKTVLYGTKTPKLEVTHKHTLEHIKAKPSTCNEEGNIEFWSCPQCQKRYSDANATNEISESDIIIHIDPTNHTGDTCIKNQKEATESEYGYTGDTYCISCNALISRGTLIEKNEHIHTIGPWNFNSYKHWRECIYCGLAMSDMEAHNGGEATCINKAICETCGVEYGSVNDLNHKNTRIVNYIASDGYYKGYTGDTYCVDCWRIVSRGTEILSPESTHKHTLEHIEANPATCHKEGNIEFWRCTICKKCYLDETAYNETSYTRIPTQGGYIRDAKKATENEYGYTGDICCYVCNEIISKGTIIEKKEHTDDKSSDEKGTITENKAKADDKISDKISDKIVEDIPPKTINKKTIIIISSATIVLFITISASIFLIVRKRKNR